MIFKLQFSCIILLTLLLSPCLISCLPLISTICPEQARSNEYFRYDFIVDGEGNALVRIKFHTKRENGSSWVFVPQFVKWSNYTVMGEVYNWTLEETEKYAATRYYLYNVLVFWFTSSINGFEIIIEYNFSLAAMIVETESNYGIFYSPMIGFKSGSEFEAAVFFPPRFKAKLNEALAIGRNLYEPDRTLSNSSFIFFRRIPLTENLLRIQIGFNVVDGKVDRIILENGIFKFNTVKRYEEHAWRILNLYNSTYNMFVNIFNTTLDSRSKGITVRFFIPDFNSLMSIGGYVPFSGINLGDIYINIMFTRYIEGYLEVIALHELIHHFLWRAGISPQDLLWFHEGLAQYISITIAKRLGYEGARIISDEIENSVKKLRVNLKDNFGFLLSWRPSYAPRDFSTLYTAAYCVINSLATEYGGLDYYIKFFKVSSGKTIKDNVALCYYLSVAANESVAGKLNTFGFNIPDIYIYWPLISEVERAIREINPNNIFLKPIRDIANSIYKIVMSGERIFFWEGYPILLILALLIAYFAPLTALLICSGLILVTLIIILKIKKVL